MPAILFEVVIKNYNSEAIIFLEDLGYEFYEIKKNFYLGESFIPRVISLILSSIFGEQNSLIEVKKFKNKYFDMILAIPKSQ